MGHRHGRDNGSRTSDGGSECSFHYEEAQGERYLCNRDKESKQRPELFEDAGRQTTGLRNLIEFIQQNLTNNKNI